MLIIVQQTGRLIDINGGLQKEHLKLKLLKLPLLPDNASTFILTDTLPVFRCLFSSLQMFHTIYSAELLGLNWTTVELVSDLAEL